jgi:hypothetical protein
MMIRMMGMIMGQSSILSQTYTGIVCNRFAERIFVCLENDEVPFNYKIPLIIKSENR